MKNMEGDKQQMLKKVYASLARHAESIEELNRITAIIDAMNLIDRSFFVPDQVSPYADRAAPIGYQQTISQPSTVGRMLFLADIRQGSRVLDVGSGSGWNACLASFLAFPGGVTSMELFPGLVQNARSNTQKLIQFLRENQSNDVKRLENIDFRVKNAFEERNASYDRIIITAGIEIRQEPRLEEWAAHALDESGILICPYRHGPIMIYSKNHTLHKTCTPEQYAFVPLVNHK